MTFWIVSVGLVLVASLALVAQLLRGRGVGAGSTRAHDLQVYRDQLKEVDRDLARGVIAEAEAERVRTEVSRRILAADAASRDGAASDGAPGRVSKPAAGLVVLILLAGSFGLYEHLGARGLDDLPLERRIARAEEIRKNRPAQAEAEKDIPAASIPENANVEFMALMDQLRKLVAERPGDLEGRALLARNEAALGNFKAAYVAQAELLELKGDGATSGDYADFADMLVLAAGGYVSPEAEQALAEALRRDSGNPTARYYYALMLGQTGRPDQAFRIWRDLLREGPRGAPWIAPIEAQIVSMAERAGVDYEPVEVPEARPSGPSREDVVAAQDMSPEERQQMIEGMVAGLAARLADEGGPPPEWARLITALGILGRQDEAAEIYAEAQQLFAEDERAMNMLAAAAERAGLAP